MKVLGEFTSRSGVDALRGLRDRTELLEGVATLSDVRPGREQSVRALFTPTTPFGQIPIAVHIVPLETNDRDASLRVHGRRGPHVLDVRLALSFTPLASGTQIAWQAEVDVRGPAASIGQRVAIDVARRAIEEVLAAVADQAESKS